ncbi:colicin E5-related ribonuclease [Burkholderia anthina]|nr:colicin E5-related ribonuclease [Burkholderia anthina]
MIDDKIARQIDERGWTDKEVQATVDDGPAGTTMDNRGGGIEDSGWYSQK